MTVKIEPLTQTERDAHRCAYCDKHLQPTFACRTTLYSNRHSSDTTAEEKLAAYQTNHRVIRVRRSWSDIRDHATDEVTGRYAHSIEVVRMPLEPDEWGFWGAFCGQLCASRFGYACHKAGWRMQRKTKEAA